MPTLLSESEKPPIAQRAKIEDYGTSAKPKFQDYVGKHRFYYKYSPIGVDWGFLFLDKKIYSENYSRLIVSLQYIKKDYPCGVEVEYKGRNIIICNGDDHSTSLVGLLPTFPTTSFDCLDLLINAKNRRFSYNTIFTEALDKGELELIDFTTDSTIKCTTTERNAWSAYFRNTSHLKAPVIPAKYIGFTVVETGGDCEWHWHRSGTCLFRFRKGGDGQDRIFLTGQDEDTYFGVELAGNPTNIKDAFLDLIPKEIRTQRWQRQGEWFIVPVKQGKVPEYWEDNVLATMDSIVLPREQDGHEHTVVGSNIIVTKDGHIFAEDGCLEHDQHQSVEFNGWVEFHKNTAVRSVSMEGVD